MPYEWISPDPADQQPPLRELHLWPHRSLPKRGFAAFIGGTFLLLLLPLYPAIGSPVLWGLLPFLMGTLGLLYWAIQRSYRDGEVLEELRIWEDKVRLERHSRHGATQDWEANPHWVEVKLHEKGGPVTNYVTLRGANREVEIGSFLSDDERVDLYNELARYLPSRG
ncbi:DUF2244 domain-containing protein [Aliiruegeria sabulilitoris]|uniref:DUF2244 domain-containing protein n=1 Tax=Aliiruegeria sabulilitoris TaxID=1510458 RepID=UPI0008377FEF|nr:DUF2244 domain-containing protein [Aliiruegeria sabulilitoris]NDR58926.1 DUF2244 domain-containing protein [Pseudoruegeria sp. M32A2M]